MDQRREVFTQCGNPAYTPATPAPPGLVYVFMQFGDQYVKAFRNCLLSRVNVLRNYKGKCLGLARQVDVIEGCWRSERAVAVFEFKSHFNAGMWLESDHEVKQDDFMNGCDIVITSTLGGVPLNKNLFQLMDVKIHDGKTYMSQYVDGHLPGLKASGGVNAVATVDYICHRGSFTPDFLVMNQWESHEEFYNWYRSEEYNSKWKPYRLNTAETNMVLFKLEPLEKA